MDFTNDDGPPLRTKSSAHSLRKHVDTLQHTLSSIVAEDDILRSVSSLDDKRGLQQAKRAGECSSGSEDDVHDGSRLGKEGDAMEERGFWLKTIADVNFDSRCEKTFGSDRIENGLEISRSFGTFKIVIH